MVRTMLLHVGRFMLWYPCYTTACWSNFIFSILPRFMLVEFHYHRCLLVEFLSPLSSCLFSASPKSEFFVDVLADSVSAMDLYGSSMKVGINLTRFCFLSYIHASCGGGFEGCGRETPMLAFPVLSIHMHVSSARLSLFAIWYAQWRPLRRYPQT